MGGFSLPVSKCLEPQHAGNCKTKTETKIGLEGASLVFTWGHIPMIRPQLYDVRFCMELHYWAEKYGLKVDKNLRYEHVTGVVVLEQGHVKYDHVQ